MKICCLTGRRCFLRSNKGVKAIPIDNVKEADIAFSGNFFGFLIILQMKSSAHKPDFVGNQDLFTHCRDDIILSNVTGWVHIHQGSEKENFEGGEAG